jgi:hypothetical protein
MSSVRTGPQIHRKNGVTFVELEFERDGTLVVISGRCADCNFVLSLPLGGAATFAAAAVQAIDELNRGTTARFSVESATLEVHR